MIPIALAVLSGVCFGSWSLTLKKGKHLGLFFPLWYATVFFTVLIGCLLGGGTGTISEVASTDLCGLIWGLGSGIGWGFATLTFGYALKLVGLGLGYAIILGIGMVIGTSASMVLTFGTPSGLSSAQVTYGLFGMFVALCGTVLTSYSGHLKSGTPRKRKKFREGIVLCIISGVLSSLFAIGYAGARSTLTTWSAILLLVSGFWIAQLIFLLVGGIKGGLRIFLSHTGAWFPVIGGVVFGLGVILHYASADAVGVALSYPMMMGIQILTGNVWSITLGEWRSAPRRAAVTQALSLVFLLLAALFIGRAMSAIP